MTPPIVPTIVIIERIEDALLRIVSNRIEKRFIRLEIRSGVNCE